MRSAVHHYTINWYQGQCGMRNRKERVSEVYEILSLMFTAPVLLTVRHCPRVPFLCVNVEMAQSRSSR